jgi:diguanylate cyclase
LRRFKPNAKSAGERERRHIRPQLPITSGKVSQTRSGARWRRNNRAGFRLMITHDPSLVILSTTIAMLGAFTACVMMSNLSALSSGERRVRVTMATVTLGGSLWAMLFVGLLSLDAPLNFAVNPLLLGGSAAAAFVGVGVALFLLAEAGRAYRARFPYAVAIFGGAVALMNYLGVAAIAGRGLNLSWFLTVVSLAVSIQVGYFTLWFLFRRRGVIATLIGSVALGLCLSATHYLTIASTQALDQTLLALPAYDAGISERYLAWSATIMMYLTCSICLCVFVITQFRDEN